MDTAFPSITVSANREMLKLGMVMYDAPYCWCESGKKEAHTWNPEAYR